MIDWSFSHLPYFSRRCWPWHNNPATVKAVSDSVILWLWVFQWDQKCGWFRYILGIIFWYQVYQTILGTTHMNAWRLHAHSMFELSWDTYLFRKSWILLMILLQECCSPVGGQNCSLSLLGWQQSEGLDSVQYPCWWGHVEFLKRNDLPIAKDLDGFGCSKESTQQKNKQTETLVLSSHLFGGDLESGHVKIIAGLPCIGEVSVVASS